MPTNPFGVPIVELSGPVLLGELGAWGLFGVLCMQVYTYYQAFPKDRLVTKCLVYVTFVLEIIDTVLLTYGAFRVFGYGFGDFGALTSIQFDFLSVPVAGGIVSFLGQTFYAYRVKLLSGSWIISAVIFVMAVVSSVAGFIAGALAVEAGNVARLGTPRMSALVGIRAGVSALGDIIIATCMTYYLSRNTTEFPPTRVVITKMIRLIVQTGSLTAVLAVVNLILFTAFRNKAYYTAGGYIIPKLYANCILVVLNARYQIVGGRESSSYSVGGSVDHGPAVRAGTGTNVNVNVVTVSREVFSDSEEYQRHDDVMEMKGIRDSHIGSHAV